MNDHCFACGGLIPEPGKSYMYAGKFCTCAEPKKTTGGIFSGDKSEDIVQTSESALRIMIVNPEVIITQPELDRQQRVEIAIRAMEAIERSNFASAHQDTLTVEEVADRAVNLTDALIERLKK
jgi:hypothetical protein